MRVGLFSIALIATVVAWARLSSGSPADGDSRLVLVESTDNRLSKSGKERLRTAISDVVSKHGLKLIPSESLPDKLRHGDLPGCLPQIAAASGAILVLRVEAKYVKESFKLAIELWNSDEGRLLGQEHRDCPICDEQDLWGSAALLVQGLLERAERETKSSPLEPPPAAVAPLLPSASPTFVAAAAASRSRGEKLIGYSGLALAVAGATVLATGIYLWTVDGDSACTRCDWDRDTGKYGRPMTIGGAVGLAAGAGLLLWRFWPSAPAVSVGPSGVAVAGHFP
jgi:hypothetical protein